MNHLIIACGSEAELQTPLELAVRLRLCPHADVNRLIDDSADVGRMLNGLISSLEHADRRQRADRHASSRARTPEP